MKTAMGVCASGSSLCSCPHSWPTKVADRPSVRASLTRHWSMSSPALEDRTVPEPPENYTLRQSRASSGTTWAPAARSLNRRGFFCSADQKLIRYDLVSHSLNLESFWRHSRFFAAFPRFLPSSSPRVLVAKRQYASRRSHRAMARLRSGATPTAPVRTCVMPSCPRKERPMDLL